MERNKKRKGERELKLELERRERESRQGTNVLSPGSSINSVTRWGRGGPIA